MSRDHDNEPRGSHRAVEATPVDARETTLAARRWRERQVCRAPLPVPTSLPAHLRATQQGQQGNRARGYLKLPSRAELGIRERLSPMGALAADSRVGSSLALFSQ
jgi:hypothetical protein